MMGEAEAKLQTLERQSGFNWNDLVFFLELARQGRLMPAARRLKVDHTTVSRRIGELEKDLALKLFERKTDGFVLTADGVRLLTVAEKMESLGNSIPEILSHAPSTPSGRVRLTTMEGIAAFYLAEKLCDFSAAYPRILVELITERHLISLTKREADISISFAAPAGPKLDIKHAGVFRLALFASETYLAARGSPACLGDLRKHDFVDYVQDLVAIPCVHWLLDIMQPERVVFRSTSMAAQQYAVAAGRGIGLLPFFSAKQDPRLVPVLTEQAVVHRDLFISVHEDIQYIGRVRALARFLVDLFRRDREYLNSL